jgi:hypothetical protein
MDLQGGLDRSGNDNGTESGTGSVVSSVQQRAVELPYSLA